MSKPVAAAQTAEAVPGLLAIARHKGERDVYAGKRGWIRYVLGMRTEVTTDPTIPFASWPVTTHNVSGGGMGFWSKRSLERGTPIHILDVSDKSAPVWIPATVMHCTVGIRGYLLGAQFDVPACPDDPSLFEAGDAEAPGGAGGVREESSSDQPSLARRVAIAAGATGVAASVAATAACALSPPAWSIVVGAGAGLAVAAGTAAIAGRWLASESRVFLFALRRAIGGLAAGRTRETALPEVAVRELDDLRSTFLELQARAQRREEGERIQRQKLEEVNQMKSNLIAIVSHDLRTPLTSILLYARMLLDDLDSLPNEDKRSFLKIIADECTRLSRLVDDLLEVQRLESDRVQWNLQEQDLSEVIRASASLFEAMAQSKSIELIVKCPAQLPPIVADGDKMSQVLSNLVSNAIKYTQVGGAVEVSAIAHGNKILVRLSDNGPGIPRDMWDSIFDRFSQIRDPDISDIAGVGLGLYIVKKIVEGHGGAVWVDSELGAGSKFYVSLPIRNDEQPIPQRVVVDGEAYRVLVCDSDPQLAAVIGQSLRRHGYDVRAAHSGKRLLTQLAPGDIDVVITDVLLPDMGADQLLEGISTIRHLDFKLIAHTYVEDGRDLKHPCIDMFLPRPVSRQDLLVALEKTIGGHVPAAGRHRPGGAGSMKAVERPTSPAPSENQS